MSKQPSLFCKGQAVEFRRPDGIAPWFAGTVYWAGGGYVIVQVKTRKRKAHPSAKRKRSRFLLPESEVRRRETGPVLQPVK